MNSEADSGQEALASTTENQSPHERTKETVSLIREMARRYLPLYSKEIASMPLSELCKKLRSLPQFKKRDNKASLKQKQEIDRLAELK